MEFKRLDDRGNDGRGYRLAYYRMRTYGKYYDTYRKSRRRLFAFLSLFQYGLYLQEEYWNPQAGHPLETEYYISLRQYRLTSTDGSRQLWFLA